MLRNLFVLFVLLILIPQKNAWAEKCFKRKVDQALLSTDTTSSLEQIAKKYEFKALKRGSKDFNKISALIKKRLSELGIDYVPSRVEGVFEILPSKKTQLNLVVKSLQEKYSVERVYFDLAEVFKGEGRRTNAMVTNRIENGFAKNVEVLLDFKTMVSGGPKQSSLHEFLHVKFHKIWNSGNLRDIKPWFGGAKAKKGYLLSADDLYSKYVSFEETDTHLKDFYRDALNLENAFNGNFKTGLSAAENDALNKLQKKTDSLKNISKQIYTIADELDALFKKPEMESFALENSDYFFKNSKGNTVKYSIDIDFIRDDSDFSLMNWDIEVTELRPDQTVDRQILYSIPVVTRHEDTISKEFLQFKQSVSTLKQKANELRRRAEVFDVLINKFENTKKSDIKKRALDRMISISHKSVDPTAPGFKPLDIEALAKEFPEP